VSDTQHHMLRWRGRETGPYSLDEINRQLDDHKIGMGHEILSEGEWITLEQFFGAQHQPAAAPAAVAMPPPAGSSGVKLPRIPPATARPGTSLPSGHSNPVQTAATASAPPETMEVPDVGEPKPRRRLVYALLGIFLGFTGVHNYYARHWLTGLLQMLLSIATFLLGFGVIASWVWAVVEAVLVRRDGNDLEMI
jgi:TM2 domain-containing membrane protein YozV